jgi:hypothetical protein
MCNWQPLMVVMQQGKFTALLAVPVNRKLAKLANRLNLDR